MHRLSRVHGCCRGWGRCCSLFGVFAFVLSEGGQTSLGSSLNDRFPVLVHLQFDDDFGRVDTDGNGGTVGLFTLNPLDVNHELLSVTLQDLAYLLALVMPADNLNLIVF